MTLRDYQEGAVEFLVPRKRGFIVAPAGSGKTLIASSAISRVVKTGWKVVWLAATREQVEQGISAIQRTPGPAGVEFEVCCVNALPDVSDADLLLVDEAHHSSAPVLWLNKILQAKPEAILWGVSATPFGEDAERNAVLRDLFKEFFTVERELVQASGHLAPGKVVFHDLDTPGEFNAEIEQRCVVEVKRRCRCYPMIARFEHERRVKWQETLESLKANRTRNAHICYTANKASAGGASVLVLVQSIEHGLALAEQMPGSVLAYSKMGAKKRRLAVEAFRNGELKILIGTQLCDEGVDFPRASVLILAAGGRASGKVIQRTGRVLRPFDGKECGLIHDYRDLGATFAAAQARARENVYRELRYEITEGPTSHLSAGLSSPVVSADFSRGGDLRGQAA